MISQSYSFLTINAFQQQCSTFTAFTDPQQGILKQISAPLLSITDIVIDVVHSLVMVVVLWYVNIHLCPPFTVTLIVSFAHEVDPLKQSKGNVLR